MWFATHAEIAQFVKKSFDKIDVIYLALENENYELGKINNGFPSWCGYRRYLHRFLCL